MTLAQNARVEAGFLTGSGEMGVLVRDHDWSATPLGPIDHWSPPLRMAVQMVLASPLPTVLAWGPDFIAVHNDAYCALLGDKPATLGRPLLDVWAEVRDELGALFNRALSGEAIRTEGAPLTICRHGRLEQGFFDYGLSPVRDEAGVVVGVLNVAVETTGRVPAAAELREGEERFRALVDVSSDVFYRMSSDWTEMRQLHGRGFVADTQEPSVGWHEAYLFPEDRPQILAVIDEAVRAKGVFELEHRVRRVDGTAGWTFSRAVPVLGADGGTVEWFGIASDVTERRRKAERLRASEARHRFHVELNDTLRPLTSPPEIMAAVAESLGPYLGVDQANYYLIEAEDFVVVKEWRTAASAGMLGSHPLADFAGSIVAGLSAGALLRLDDTCATDGAAAFAAAGIAAVLSAPLRSGGRWAGGLHVHSVAPRTWTDEEAALVRETADRAWAAMEHARAEAELRASEARYRQIVEGADDFAIITTDEAGIITSWNAGAERLLGFCEDAVVGRSADIFFTPEDRERGALAHEMSRAESEGRAVNERWHMRKDGSRFWGSGLMMRLEQGGGFLKMFRDRTAEHEAEARRGALADLGDALRDLQDPTDIAFAAAEILGRVLGLRRVGYAAIDHDAETLHVERDWAAPGVTTLGGVLSLRDYGSFIDSMKRGEMTVIGDVRQDPRTADRADVLERHDVRSFVNAPVIEHGRLAAVFYVNHARVRDWTEGDLSLVKEFADRTRTAVERARGEAALRESEARFSFLDRLGAETAALADADAVLATTTLMLGRHLDLSVCAYADMDEDQDGFTIRGDWAAPGSQSIVGHYSLADFGTLAVTKLSAGLPFVVNDTLRELAPEEAAMFQTIGIAATICMPLVKEGRLTALMAVHDCAPRVWTEAELSLLREVTARSWAHVERVAAVVELRDSEARYRTLFETIESGFCVVEVDLNARGGRIDYRVVEANPAFFRQTGFPEAIMDRWLREAAPALEDDWFETYGRILRSGVPERFEQGSDALGRWFDVYAFRAGAPDERRVAIWACRKLPSRLQIALDWLTFTLC